MLYNELLSSHNSTPTYCEAIAELAIYHMRERDFYEAFAYLKRTQLLALKSNPTDQLLRLAEGVTFLMKKKCAEGILLVGAVTLTLKHSLADHGPFLDNLKYNAMGFGNFSIGNHLCALEQYRLITVESDTDMAAAEYNIALCEGILHHKNGQHSQATEAFERAFSILRRP